MKKTLLAAALLAGFAGAAQAETAVTLYGIIDTGLGYNKISGGTPEQNGSKIGMINSVQSGSRWGLRGSEDLGDGLRAVFQLESGFDSTNGRSGQKRLFGRQATIGLANDSWGQLDFGRQVNITSKYFASIDPLSAAYGQSNIGVGFSAANTYRLDNLILYQTPSFDGFQFGIGYSFSADDTDTTQSSFRTADNTRAVTMGLRYVNGPLNVALTFDQLNASNKLPQASVDATPRQYSIGGSYDFEVVKLALAYARTADGWFAGQEVKTGDTPISLGKSVFAQGFKANSYLLGLSAPIDVASNVFGSWQRVSPWDATLTGGAARMNVFSLGYTYDLSKRTNLYAYGSYAKNFAFLEELKSTALGVGLRHRF